MLKRNSIFQEKLDERNLHRHEILYSAFMSLYWQVQHGIAYRNFPSMLKMMRTIGLEKLEHFQHESLWSVRGILTTMGRVIKEKITKAANEAKCYGLMLDDVTDIQVKEQHHFHPVCGKCKCANPLFSCQRSYGGCCVTERQNHH